MCHPTVHAYRVVRKVCVFGGKSVLGVWVWGCFLSPPFPPNPSHPAVGPRTPQFLAALMSRSGLGKHRSSPLRSGRAVQSSSKGGDWPQVGWLCQSLSWRTPLPALSPHVPVMCEYIFLSHCMASDYSSSSQEELLGSPFMWLLLVHPASFPSSDFDSPKPGLVSVPLSSHINVNVLVPLQPEKMTLSESCVKHS